MNNEHPITPPPELVEHWYDSIDPSSTSWKQELATRAARWGADQELEACCAWVEREIGHGREWNAELRAARRPKPPTLKEQALAVLMNADGADHPVPVLVLPADEAAIIRRALELVPDDAK